MAVPQPVAQQADIEGMPTSAAYWRAEVQRLTTQQQGSDATTPRPGSTGAIVVGCTLAALATVGGVIVASSPSTPATASNTAPLLAGRDPGQPVKGAQPQQHLMSGGHEPIVKQFSKGVDVYEVQALLSGFVAR